MKNIVICGVGGQGTVLASKILANTFIKMGRDVSTSETIGMAQRGGCVTSHVRIDEFSPITPKKCADALLAFEPSEAVRNLDLIKDDAIVIVNTNPVVPVSVSLMGIEYDYNFMIDFLKANVKNLVLVDGKEICQKVGNIKVLNVCMIGILCKKSGIDINLVKEILKENMPQKILDINLLAIDAGYGVK